MREGVWNKVNKFLYAGRSRRTKTFFAVVDVGANHVVIQSSCTVTNPKVTS